MGDAVIVPTPSRRAIGFPRERWSASRPALTSGRACRRTSRWSSFARKAGAARDPSETPELDD